MVGETSGNVDGIQAGPRKYGCHQRGRPGGAGVRHGIVFARGV